MDDELTIVIKDWLKQKGKTQKDLCKSLGTSSDRMSFLLDALKKDYSLGGLPQLAEHLCAIEEAWSQQKEVMPTKVNNSDPFGQLDLLLEEIKEDCNK